MTTQAQGHGPVQGSLEYWAQQKPDDVAIVDEDGTPMTWKQWNDQANQLAEAFVQAGLGPRDVVAVRMKTRPEWFVVTRALAKIGCIQVGVNWRNTSAEMAYILHDSGAKGLICDDEDPSLLAESWKDRPSLVRFSVGVPRPVDGFLRYEDFVFRTDAPPRDSGVINPLTILYTSGTTGQPKGVLLSPELREKRKKELNEYVQDMSAHICSDRMLLNLPVHHGAGPRSARITHMHGHTVYLMRRFDPEKTLAMIEQYRITFWYCVPTMLKRIAGLAPEVLQKYDVSSIKTLMCGADPVPPSLKEWAIQYFGDGCLYEGYGATEVSGVSMMPPEMQLVKPGSSGKPYRHVSISVRDDTGRELPPGEVGELWVKTPSTIDRYFNRPPLGPDTLDENGYFRTGDVGYLDEDGYLYITDRKKDMIISGGVNIYPAEIEAVLLKHPAVDEAAVIGIPDEDMGEQVKAFCVLKPGQSVSEEELLAFCSRELASYKRPRSIDFVASLPRNSLGKILKRELRAPYWKEFEKKV